MFMHKFTNQVDSHHRSESGIAGSGDDLTLDTLWQSFVSSGSGSGLKRGRGQEAMNIAVAKAVKDMKSATVAVTPSTSNLASLSVQESSAKVLALAETAKVQSMKALQEGIKYEQDLMAMVRGLEDQCNPSMHW
jgi:hypothetical protein